jgi:hypothetical protein
VIKEAAKIRNPRQRLKSGLLRDRAKEGARRERIRDASRRRANDTATLPGMFPTVGRFRLTPNRASVIASSLFDLSEGFLSRSLVIRFPASRQLVRLMVPFEHMREKHGEGAFQALVDFIAQVIEFLCDVSQVEFVNAIRSDQLGLLICSRMKIVVVKRRLVGDEWRRCRHSIPLSLLPAGRSWRSGM